MSVQSPTALADLQRAAGGDSGGYDAVAGTLAGLAAVAPASGFTPADLTVAVALLTVLAAAVASALPAVLAATRDPVSVLRTT